LIFQELKFKKSVLELIGHRNLLKRYGNRTKICKVAARTYFSKTR